MVAEIYFELGELNTLYQFVSACIHFQLCSGESQSREKCVTLTLSCKISRLKLSFGIREKFTCILVDLI